MRGSLLPLTVGVHIQRAINIVVVDSSSSYSLASLVNMPLLFLVIISLVFSRLILGEFSFRPEYDVGISSNLPIVEETVKTLLAPHARKCDLHFIIDRDSLMELTLADRFRSLLPDFGVNDQSFYGVLDIKDEQVRVRFRQRKCTAFLAFVYGGSLPTKLFYIRNLIAKADSMRLLLLTDNISDFLFAFRHIQGVAILETDNLLFHYHHLPAFEWQVKDVKALGGPLNRLQTDFFKDVNIRNLNNETLTISSLSFYFPFTAWTTLENGTQVQTGLEHRIVRELQEPLGFRIQNRLPFDGAWGGISPNGTYIDGIVGDVFYGRADIAFADLYFMYDRSMALDTVIYDYECTVIAVPWPEISRWLTLIYIFEYQVSWGTHSNSLVNRLNDW